MIPLRRTYNDLIESIRIAYEQLRVHKMRSMLTALGVIIGVAAVILMGFAINGIDTGFQNSINMLGTDQLYVQKWPWKNVGDDWMLYRNRRSMDTRYADQLNEIIGTTPNSGLVIAVPTDVINQRISRNSDSISGIRTMGTTSDYNFINTGEIEEGRFFTQAEALAGQNVIVLGFDVAQSLFPEGIHLAPGQNVKIKDINFTVIGTLARQGSFLGMQSFDNQAILPLQTMRKFFTGHRWRDTTSIHVLKKTETPLEVARDEIIGAMRRVRHLEPGASNDFEVNSSDALEDTFGPVKKGVTIAGFFITGLALFVGAIGIMNITFVSVKERTPEIGTRRAIGARQSSILIQFLTESTSICLIGGIIGVILAFIAKLLITHYFPNFPGSFSPALIALAFILSVCTGIFSGFIPAYQASRLDPATALRQD